ncbi:MAG: CoA transferase [Chloroflexi bacterium]|nr:CoA transferase [Chloroflexota bacterium]
MAGVLDDVRVLELGGELGAWCGKLLADMGADVIKVEPPTGDETRRYPPFFKDEPDKDRSLYFWHYNTNKKSVTLDLHTDQGRRLFRELATSADVIVDSFPPGLLDGLGVGYQAISQIRPSIIMAAISPFGQDMPYSHHAATDLTALAFGGPAWSCGYDDHSLPPIRGGGNQAYHTTCHFAAAGIMTALVHRQFTGVGQFIDVNMHAAQNVTTEGSAYNWLVAGDTVQRQTGRHAAVNPTPDAQMVCRDGRYLNIGFPARTEDQWFHLLAWLEEEGLVGDLSEYMSPPSRQALAKGDPTAIKQIHDVMEAVQALCLRFDAYELFRRAQDLGFQWGIIYSPEEALEDPHFRERGMQVTVEHPELGDAFIYPGAPYRFEATPWAIRRRPPLLGEDNEDVYVKELGMSSQKLKTLQDEGVV